MKEIENFENIFLDEEGYTSYINKIKELKTALNEIDSKISKLVLEDKTEDVTNDYERLKVSRNQLKELIEKKEQDINRIIIVVKGENADKLDIGDVVKVKLSFPNGDVEEETFELTAGENDLSGEVSKISINVPLGKCVYKKEVGDTDSYDIRDGKVQVTILEKIKVKSLKKVSEDL